MNKLITGQVDRFARFICERENIRVRKEAGKPQHEWTKDAILGRFRFCNVRREDDRVTRWIAENWRSKLEAHKDLFFAMAVARLINWPPTLQDLGASQMVKGNLSLFVSVMDSRATFELKRFGGAYIVSTNGHAMDKARYLAEHVLEPLYAARDELRPRHGDTLASFSARLQTMNGFKGFMAGQIVADVKYAKPGPLYHASDWQTWAVSGPGSKRGLNRICARDLTATWKEPQWLTLVQELRELVNHRLTIGALHAQDIQNCLCEFDKYERVRLGQGQPRALYRSHEEN